MRNRVLIFEDEEEIRQGLTSLFHLRNYEVFAFPHPNVCPLSKETICPCPEGQACADIILSDLKMPFKNGLSFIEEQINKGCRCKHIALMSGLFTDEDVLKASSRGLKIFKKPFYFSEIIDWLNQVEKEIDPKRKLSNLFLQ